MKKVYASFFLVLLLVTNLSFGSVQHYCGGHLMKTEFQLIYANSLSCGMVEDSGTTSVDSQFTNESDCDNYNEHITEKDCCENQFNFLEMGNVVNDKQIVVDINPTLLISWVATFLIPVDFQEITLPQTSHLLQLCNNIDLNILYQVFII